MSSIPGPILKRLIEAEGRFDARDFAGAAAIYERVLKQLPGQINALVMLARVRMMLGEPAKSVELARRAVSVAPGDAGALVCLGNALLATDRAEEGVGALERAIAAGYGGDDARVALTEGLVRLGRDGEAIAQMDAWGADASGAPVWRRHPKLAMNRGAALLTLGRVREAIDAYREGVAAHPADASLRSALLTALNYDDAIAAEEVLAAHRAFGAHVRAETARDLGTIGRDSIGLDSIGLAPMQRDANPERALRVGLLSPDFREHSVAWFVGPMLGHVDASRVRLVCAYSAVNHDVATERLRDLALTRGHEWLDVGGVAANPVELVRALRDAGLDVLVELSGHTHGHRLRAVAMRGAPVQVTYLGYPNTTGLGAIDARLVDSRTDPAGAEALATERLVRLDPCFLCFGPRFMGAMVSGLSVEPAMVRRGHVTFASFNAVQKIGPRCLELWKRVLDGVPNSRLVLKGLALGQAAATESLRSRIAAAGIDVARVDLLAPDTTREAHLDRYREVDIALDTFPYHGTTTTCQALMMGVPVVTRVGDRHASRVGDSLLHAVGLGELAARSDEAFGEIATGLARDAAALTRVRSRLIEGFAGSALCDGAAFARRFEGAMRELWREWCVRHPDGVCATGAEL